MVQKVAVKREFEAGLRNATTGKLSLSVELGKDKAATEERWALRFISCVLDTVEF